MEGQMAEENKIEDVGRMINRLCGLKFIFGEL